MFHSRGTAVEMTFISHTLAKKALFQLSPFLCLSFRCWALTSAWHTTSAGVMRNNDVKCGGFIVVSQAKGFRAAKEGGETRAAPQHHLKLNLS